MLTMSKIDMPPEAAEARIASATASFAAVAAASALFFSSLLTITSFAFPALLGSRLYTNVTSASVCPASHAT
jgi:hypothetical protein